MKILVLNPNIDAKHQIIQALRAKGFGVICVSHVVEAAEALRVHGRTIEFAIVHREAAPGAGNGEPGLDFVRRFRTDPDQSDLPYLISSSTWNDSDFAQHQKSSLGAHAYLKFPFAPEAVIGVMEKMFGDDLYRKDGPMPIVPPAPTPGFGDLVLEESAVLDSIPEDAGFLLEMPDVDEEEEEPEEPAMGSPTSADLARSLSKKKKKPKKRTGDAAAKDAGRLLRELAKTGQSDEKSKQESELDRILEGTRGVDREKLPSSDGLFNNQTLFKEILGGGAGAEGAPGANASAGSEREKKLRSEIEQEILAREMPYLFGAGNQTRQIHMPTGPTYDASVPLGNAVVPGGAANSPDEDTLRKFLELREQDVAALSAQLKTAREQNAALEDSIRNEKSQNEESVRKIEAQQKRIDEFEKEKEHALDAVRSEIEEIRFQNKSKADRVRILESKVKEATSEAERLKERVRMDIRKIRIREKELENRLEIMRRDSEALIGARENKIVELKRKLDLIEFNMDLLQDQYNREKENSHKLRERFSRALQAVRVAGGLLDNTSMPTFTDEDDDSPLATIGDDDDEQSYVDEISSEVDAELGSSEVESESA